VSASEFERSSLYGPVLTFLLGRFRQMDVINKATVETSGGAFVSHFGNKQWL